MKPASLLLLIIMGTSLLLSSCSTVDIEDYQDTSPNVNLQAFFEGDLVAYGMVRDRSGKVIRHFNATLVGTWDDGVGTLDEVFWFNDGERQTRVWTMTPEPTNREGDLPARYIGTAGDVEGEAMIETKGQAIRLKYQLRIPYDGDEIVVTMDDWMYQVAPGIILNETLMSKWGVHLATISLVIMKQ